MADYKYSSHSLVNFDPDRMNFLDHKEALRESPHLMILLLRRKFLHRGNNLA